MVGDTWRHAVGALCDPVILIEQGAASSGAKGSPGPPQAKTPKTPFATSHFFNKDHGPIEDQFTSFASDSVIL